MAHINEHYLTLKESYLFSDIAKRVKEYTEHNPDKKLIRLGIGDVTLPLAPAVTEAIHKAVDEMGSAATFKGYGPEQGYGFLRTAIADYYSRLGVELDANEVFVSDGAKSDIGNLTDLFDNTNIVLVPDPVYPVYVDTNQMNGRTIRYMNASMENGFLPMPDESVAADLIYLCSPNNPTGSVYNHEQLAAWVAYAKRNNAVIIFDAAYESYISAAYESYISDVSLPRSIYQIPGAKECAIEVCSLSKTAGFTGTRCGYTIVPFALTQRSSTGVDIQLHKLWLRRQTTKFNGVPYVIQRGAEAVFAPEGQGQIKEMVAYYMGNAKILAEALSEVGIEFVGGINSPYIWLRCPEGMGSWEFFDYLLKEAALVGTPGEGFGANGEGFFRLTSFGNRENTTEAAQRLKALLKK